MLFILPKIHINRESRERKFDLRINLYLGTQNETATEINTAENWTHQFERLPFGCVVILRRRVVTAFFLKKKNAMKWVKFCCLPIAGSALNGVPWEMGT